MVSQRSSNLMVLGVLLAGMLMKPSVAVALEVGEQAPDFALPSTTGEQISLSQFRGKKLVLLEFYGVDFAPTCVANLSARKADYRKFQELNIEILCANSSQAKDRVERANRTLQDRLVKELQL